ncbi:MAG: hypothetical protein ACRCZP_19760 [Phycicoccus sp.]
MTRRRVSMSTMVGSAGASSVTIRMPGSDVFPFDEFHARRALVGGTLARCWFAFTHGGTNYVRSFSHGPTAVLTSRADPTVHVPSLGGRSHRYVALGTTSRTAAQVVSDCITSLALDGITATDGGVDPDNSNRRLLVISGASALTMPAAVTLDRRERGMWGAQRDDWGTGASFAVTLNATGGTSGTGSIHVGNPNTQSGMSGRTGRVLGVYLWAGGGHAPRLAAFTGAAYPSTPPAAPPSPGALTPLGQGVSAAIGGGSRGFGGVLFDAAAFGAAANIWTAYRENAASGPGYRNHGSTPEGRGDVALSQQLIWDTVASASSASAFGATYTPTASATFTIYISIGVIFELQDSNGNYPADGSIDEWVGDQNPSASHGTQFLAGIGFLTGETTHQRFIFPTWTAYQATQVVRAVTAIAADETTRPAIYGPWTSLTHPAGTAPALIYDADTFGTMSVGWNTLTFSTPIEMETPASSGQHLSLGFNYVRTGGAAITTWELPVFLDEATGDNCWIDAWADDRTTWHDQIIGASGARALASGVQEYRTQNNVGMPNTDPASRYPNPMATDAGDDSPIAIALDRLRIVRAGMAAA